MAPGRPVVILTLGPGRGMLEQLQRWGRDEARLTPPPADALRQRLEGLGWREGVRLCIFGCGLYGHRLWRELKGRDIRVDCFADKDARKWGGRMADGTPAELDKAHTLVVTAVAEPEELTASLAQQGFTRVVPYQQIWETIIDACPGDFARIHVE